MRPGQCVERHQHRCISHEEVHEHAARAAASESRADDAVNPAGLQAAIVPSVAALARRGPRPRPAAQRTRLDRAATRCVLPPAAAPRARRDGAVCSSAPGEDARALSCPGALHPRLCAAAPRPSWPLQPPRPGCGEESTMSGTERPRARPGPANAGVLWRACAEATGASHGFSPSTQHARALPPSDAPAS